MDNRKSLLRSLNSPIDYRPILHQSEHPWFWVARLGLRCHRTNFHETKTSIAQSIDRFSMLIEPGCYSDWIAQLPAEQPQFLQRNRMTWFIAPTHLAHPLKHELTNTSGSLNFCFGNSPYLKPITAARWHISGGHLRTIGIKIPS